MRQGKLWMEPWVKLGKMGVMAVMALGVAVLAAPAPALAACPNGQIRQQQGSAYLPVCMAFELVSPPRKESQPVYLPSISANGDRVRFKSRGAMAGTPGVLEPFKGDDYIASRGGGGWSTAPTTPPGSFGFGYSGLGGPKAFAPDLGSWYSLQSTVSETLAGQMRIYQSDLDGAWTARSPLLAPLTGDHGIVNAGNTRVEGVSADLSHIFFGPGDLSAFYLPGDPEPAGSAANPNGYIAARGDTGEPTLALLARDSDGKVWGGNCGSWVGGGRFAQRRGGRNQGAISAGGTQVYFSTRPEHLGGDCTGLEPIRILRRVETQAGPQISEPVSSECDRAAALPTVPACGTTAPLGEPVPDGDDLFQGASVDGSKLYFTSTRQLTDSDIDAGRDLYLYDSSGSEDQRLTQVSTAATGAAEVDMGVVAVSGDGSHVYFVAQGILTAEMNPEGDTAQGGVPNLYVYERDASAPAGRIAFLGTLAPGDAGRLFDRPGDEVSFNKSGAMAVPLLGRDISGGEVGGDGHLIVFESSSPLTDDDGDDLRRDVFRYDADIEDLVRISKAAPGGSDNGPIDVLARAANGVTELIPQPDFAEFLRWVSEDGQTIVFATREGLVAGDNDDRENPYFWRSTASGQGELIKLPGDKDPGANTVFVLPTLSHSGDEVAFLTTRKLLAEDGDTAEDVYVARVGGGFLAPTLPSPCVGEECQGLSTPSPLAPVAASGSFAGGGNVKEGKPRSRCGKGKVRKRGKCVKPKTHRKHSPKNAGRKSGDGQ